MEQTDLIEKRTIQIIPENERYGKSRDLFTTWFAANIHPLALVTGALSTTVLGLPLGWAIVAMVTGLTIGGILMALHSAQGPQLGLAQMIQSRGQFGSYGALILVLITISMYLGFFSSTIAVGGESFSLVWTSLGRYGGVIIAALIGVAVASLGYKAIHTLGKVITIVSGILMTIAGIWLFFLPELKEAVTFQGELTAAGFFAMVAVGAVWLLAYGPYVSDYSRYMPSSYGGLQRTFWTTFIGGLLGTLLPMVLGASIGLIAKGDILESIPDIYGNVFGVIFLIGTGFVLVHINAMNLYGGVLCIVTAGQTFRPSWSPGARTRAVAAAGFAVVAFVIATWMSADLMENFLNFIDILLYAMIPWSAINLADFYIVRRGKYDLQSLAAADGGIYGRVRMPAVLALIIGLFIQIPFSALSFYTGPVASALNGVDIAWIVGFLVSGLAFLLINRFYNAGKTEETTQDLQIAERSVL